MRNLFALPRHTLRARVACVLLLVGLSTGLYALCSSNFFASPINEARAELPDAPRVSDRQVAIIVSTLLQKDHISKQKLDDEVSEKALKMFLKNLDPAKVYFYQSDVDRFMKSHHDLDDMLIVGDISFAYTVFKTLLTRIDERIEWINVLLKEKHDFSIDEEMVIDAEDIGYAKTKDEARDRWRKRIKYNLLQQKADKVDDAEARKKLARRYQSFAKRMRQTDSDELLEMYLTAITTTYDPHTSYMSPTSLENFYILMRLKLEGIGAALYQEDGRTIISKIIPGGAADKEGHLKPKDVIVAVDSKGDGKLVDVVDMKLSDVVKMIRGKKDTIVRLQVIPQGKSEKKIYTITRAKIELKDSEARSEIIQEGKKVDGTPYNIGVIDLPSFYMDMESAKKGIADFKSTTRDVKKILVGFKEKNLDAVILDLRRNGGGSLSEAINLTGLFIDHGPVVQVKGSDDKVTQYSDHVRGAIWEGPLIVLTSKLSASASEIFAGAIQDYHRGLVLGDHATHGKGTVQSLVDLGERLYRRLPNPPKLGALKVTIQQFYRPNGASTQNRGVLADVELPSLMTHMDIGEADLEYSLKFDRVDAVDFKVLKMVEEPVVTQLKQLSEARVKKSKDFKKVNEKIARYEKRKNRKTVSLNEKKFMADRAEAMTDVDKEKEKEKEEEKKKKKDETPPVVQRNFYFNETLNITLDYLRLMSKHKVARAG